MKTHKDFNKVVILGSNNFNGLGLVRSFGKNGIKPYGIITGKDEDEQDGFVHKSCYWEKTWHVKGAKDAVELLLREFANEEKPPVVISYTDKIVQLLDERWEELSGKFIIHSMGKRSNGINDYASKKAQVDLAKRIGFDMLETRIVVFSEEGEVIDPGMDFPIILKPVAGGEGEKHDITICYNKEDYDKAMNSFRAKRYRRILQQPYLTERTEYVTLGAINPESGFVSFTVLRNIRQWPKDFGVGCYSEYVTDTATIDYVKTLFDKLARAGYDGPIDIELFRDGNGKFYVNEFNWRVSGRNFIALDTKVYSVPWWYFIKTGHPELVPDGNRINTKKGYTMKGVNDFKNVSAGNISLWRYLCDFLGASGSAVFCASDLRPVFSRIWVASSRFLKQIIGK